MTSELGEGRAEVLRAVKRVYGDQEPDYRWVTQQQWDQGGPDPLDEILVYARQTPVAHWHYVGVGLTQGLEQRGGEDDSGPVRESGDDDGRGWTFELTARLARQDRQHEHPPVFMANVLQNLARYVAESGNAFGPGHTIDLFGPIQQNADTPVSHVLFVDDPELGEREESATADGPVRIQFLQIVGLTADEVAAKKSWTLDGFKALFEAKHPLLITRLDRLSILTDPAVSSALDSGRARDGSMTGGMVVESLEVVSPRRFLGRLRRPVHTISLGASMVDVLCLLLPLRIDFERTFEVYGPGTSITFTPDEGVTLHEHEPGRWILGLSSTQARALAAGLTPRAGSYTIDGLSNVRFQVHPTHVRNQEGDVIATIG